VKSGSRERLRNLVLCLMLLRGVCCGQLGDSRRNVTVADSIRMTAIENPNYSSGSWGRDDVAAFSPNGKRFVVIVKQGNLLRNTVDYKLLLFHTANLKRYSRPDLLAKLSSSSDRPAIDSITWLNDNEVAFLGENAGEHHQLFELNCSSRRLRQLTSHTTNVQHYAFDRVGDVFFAADKQPSRQIRERSNLIVENENLYQLVSGTQAANLAGEDLFEVRKGSRDTVPLRTKGDITGFSSLWPSPNGRYLALRTIVTVDQVPREWFNYSTVSQNTLLSRDSPSKVEQYELLDLLRKTSKPLIDAPVAAWYSNAVWAADSRSVVVAGSDLPLSHLSLDDRCLREARIFVAEVSVPDRVIKPITTDDAIIRSWQHHPFNELVLQLTSHDSFSTFVEGSLVAYLKIGEKWEKQPLNGIGVPRIAVEENMNMPPRLVAHDLKLGKTYLLLDPNPQFKEMRFGRVEELKCKSGDGRDIAVGLYRPPDYVPGRRYPLVIQTHGWSSDRFWIDGPYTSALAAQPLAAKDIVVVQVGDDFPSAGFSSNEAKRAMVTFEGIINSLNQAGLIDPNRIGIVAFSATGPGVAYAIAHSKYHFRAAVLCDTDDAGYFAYISMFNVNGGLTQQFESLNGGPPFGRGFASWVQDAPEFSVNRINTAIRLEPHSAMTTLLLWEWFVGYRRLGKPVEMNFIPNAGHVATRPQDRMLSQGGSVDWFDFWLRDETDRDPVKRAQYLRWRALRKLARKEVQ
jgi:dipeptidyl aminopeptidase/acylaminoacyl peptidase